MISGIAEGGGLISSLQDSYLNGRSQARNRNVSDHNYAMAEDFERKMLISQAQGWGIAAQRNALMEALRQVNPNHPLLRVNGTSSDGKNRTQLADLYDSAFDKHMSKWVPGVDPKRHRPYKIR